eukprot:516610_1
MGTKHFIFVCILLLLTLPTPLGQNGNEQGCNPHCDTQGNANKYHSNTTQEDTTTTIETTKYMNDSNDDTKNENKTKNTKNQNTKNGNSKDQPEHTNDQTEYSHDESGLINNEHSMINSAFGGYVIVIILCIFPLLLIIFGAIYNKHQFNGGSDSPTYMSIFKGFSSIANLYTSIVFCVSLAYTNKSVLIVVTIIFILIKHLVSNIIGLYYINKWTKQNVKYITRYASLVFVFNLITGFYPSIEILSSKLFYCEALSMQLSHSQRYIIQILTITTNVFFLNIPLIIIIILSILPNGKMDSYAI